MAVVQVTIIPSGPAGASISKYVAHCLDVLEESGLKYELTPMATVIEGDLDRVMEAVLRMHEETFGGAVVRVLTSISIDDRRDKSVSIDGKLAAVRRHRAE